MVKAALRASKSPKLELPVSWMLSGGNPAKYESGADQSEPRDEKKWIVLKSKDDADTTNKWATAMTMMKPDDFQGKRVKLTMQVKTESASWVAPWMRVDEQKDTISFDNACNRQIHESEDWQDWTIVLDVPENSTNIAYGVMLGGSGKVWINEPVLTEVDDDVETTDCACMSKIGAKSKKPRGATLKLSRLGGWLDHGGAKYDVGVDEAQSYNGQNAACINIREATASATAELYQFISGHGWSGKRVRLTVQVKSLNVKKGVLLLEVLGPHNGTLALDDMENRSIIGTHDWSEQSIVLDVPEGASYLRIGMRATGSGTIWFSGLSFEEVDESISVTDDYSTGCRGIWWNAPINLDFSEDEEAKYKEQSCKLGRPAKGWLGWSSPKHLFEIGMDASTRHNNKNSGCIKKVANGGTSDLAWLFQKFDGKIYRNKRVRLTAFLKTVGVIGECGLSLMVMNAKQETLFSKNTFDLDSDSEHDWVKREIVVDVPAHAGVLMLSLELVGAGSAWINDVAFEVVDKEVPLTISHWQSRPKNLDLTELCDKTKTKQKNVDKQAVLS
jgi:hypothetical protein